MKTALRLIVMIFLSACHRGGSAYEQFARDSRPLLKHMREAAKTVLGYSGGEDSGDLLIVQACSSVDEDLQALQQLPVPRTAERYTNTPVPELAEIIRDQRSVFCKGTDTSERIRRCSSFCVTNWTALVIGIERLRAAARPYDVEIEPLVE